MYYYLNEIFVPSFFRIIVLFSVNRLITQFMNIDLIIYIPFNINQMGCSIYLLDSFDLNHKSENSNMYLNLNRVYFKKYYLFSFGV